MALLDLDQTTFRPIHRLDVHTLLESWVRLVFDIYQ
jgi:hypothetical protein